MRTFRIFLCTVLVLCVLIPLAKRIRAAFFLPEQPVAILRYEQIVKNAGMEDTSVSFPSFYQHFRSLSEEFGYTCLSERHIARYRRWGARIPEESFVLTVDTETPELLEEYEGALREVNATSFVALQTSCITDEADSRGTCGGVELLTWREIAAAEARGTLHFVPQCHAQSVRTRATPDELCADLERALSVYEEKLQKKARTMILPPSFDALSEQERAEVEKFLSEKGIVTAFSGAAGIAEFSSRTAWLSLPRVPVAGGRPAFRIELHQNSLTPESFGELRIYQPEGRPLKLALRVYCGGAFTPFLKAEFDPCPPDRFHSVRIPSEGLSFPLEVYLYDEFRVIQYFFLRIPRNDAIRPKGYRTPLLAPGDMPEAVDPLPLFSVLSPSPSTVLESFV